MIKLQDNKYKTFQIVPDRFLKNNKINQLADALYSIYSTPSERIKFQNWKLNYKKKPAAFWEIVITSDNVAFYISFPKAQEGYMINQLETCWNKATVKESDSTFLNCKNDEVEGAYLHLSQHYCFSLKTDKRSNAPLPELLELKNSLKGNDKAIVQICLNPANRDWYQGAEEAYKKIKQGQLPKRLELNRESVINGITKTGLFVCNELAAVVDELLTGEEVEPEPIEDTQLEYMKRDGISRSTNQKTRYNAFDTTIRLLSSSKDENRRKAILRGLATSFKSLSNDNELIADYKITNEQVLVEIENRLVPLTISNPDYLSTSEIARMIQLPTWTLQEEYKIENVSNRELDITSHMLENGILIGNVTKKGNTTPVFSPVNNYDELCLPRVVIGSMGCGKSEGYGAGFAADSIRQGFSAFAIDVADGDMADTIRDSLPINFPKDHIIDLDFGNTEYPIYLNWSEVANSKLKSRKISNIMASQLVSYMDKFSDESGGRTERYMKASAKAVYQYDPEATILEVILMLLSPDYRKQVIEQLEDARLIDLWTDFDSGMSENMRRQIMSPILNRLDSITGNDDIANCVMQRSKGNIDFRKWADGDEGGPYCVLLRVPKSKLLESGTDAIVTYLVAKMWLAILTRMDAPTNKRKPCFLIMDEPHQYLSSGIGGARSTWGQMIVESRKWRLGLIFMMHDWLQMSKELRSLIKSAGSHYILYNTKKEIFKDLAEEIKPFTAEEAIEIQTYYAINIIKSKNKYHKFLAKMAEPPIDIKKKESWRYHYVDRSHITDICSKKHGRYIDDVESDIYRRESIIYKS